MAAAGWPAAWLAPPGEIAPYPDEVAAELAAEVIEAEKPPDAGQPPGAARPQRQWPDLLNLSGDFNQVELVVLTGHWFVSEN